MLQKHPRRKIRAQKKGIIQIHQGKYSNIGQMKIMSFSYTFLSFEKKPELKFIISGGNIKIQAAKMWIRIEGPRTQVRLIILLQRETKSHLVTNLLMIDIATPTIPPIIHRTRRRNEGTVHLKQSIMTETIVVNGQKNMIGKLTKKQKRRLRRSGSRN